MHPPGRFHPRDRHRRPGSGQHSLPGDGRWTATSRNVEILSFFVFNYPALKQLEFINPSTGNSKAGDHAFRRFRNTHLRNRTGCPEGLQKFWMGHADESMSDLYDKIKEDVTFRRGRAEKCGFGFKLPSVVPNVPKIEEKTRREKSRKSL